ncbi:SRPBCC family protein [Olivibacter sp. SA151]|uniref:SRPBCC family protein n=1 Tax=Olivibacter jilunii TaxID=985016 RepID=UPI003F159E17
MENYGKIIAPGTIRFERLLPGPIERVWAYITESDKREKWLASGEMDLKVGGKVNLHFVHANLSSYQETPPDKYKCYEHGNSFSGTVIQCTPPYLLTFTWGDGSEVTFELHKQEEKILLILTHRHLEAVEARISVASGWHTHLGILVARLERREPAGFWGVHNQMEKEYTEILTEL